MIDKLSAIATLKEKFINQRKEILATNITALQKKLYSQLFDRVISALDIAEGDIINSDSNVSIVAIVDKIFKEFESDLSNLMQKVAGDYNSLIDYNAKYYAQFNTALFALVKTQVTDAMQARAGYSSTGFDKNGFIESIITDKTIAQTIKQTVLSAVLNGTPLKNLIKTVNDSIIGTTELNGALENYFQTYVYDTYSQFDRETGNQFAVQLDLNYGWYQGGLVEHSRPFCIERNGKVFTRAEVQKFGTPSDKFGGYSNKSKGEFAGKNKNYIPERDLGGYNCGHYLNWVDYTIAKSIRPDIPKV